MFGSGAVIRLLLIVFILAGTAGAVVAYGDPDRIAHAHDSISQMLRPKSLIAPPPVQIPRGQGGEFSLKAKINGVSAPMVIDTGASSVVLTQEAARAAGLPIEVLDYSVNVDTANGRTRAAPVTLARLAVGNLIEHDVPALVVRQGQLRNNLLGMSFLNRLESWEVRGDKLRMRGYP